jgi:hypothetical protein
MVVKGRTGGPLSERHGDYGFESCWKKRDEVRTVCGTHPLVGERGRVPCINVQAVTTDSCRITQVQHGPQLCCCMDVNQCSWLHYIIAVGNKTRQAM